MGLMDNLSNLAKKAQAKIQEVAAQVSPPGVAATSVAVQDWYYTKDGKKKIGPISFEQMKDLATSGQLLPSDMVMQDGKTKWKAASEVQEFFPASGSTPPPPLPPPAPPEPSEWHFTQNGQQAGPVTWTQLKTRAASGQLLATDMVWKNGMAAWAAAGSIRDLFPTSSHASPPLPPAVILPALLSKVAANRVTGELNVVGSGLRRDPLHIMLDNEEVGTKSQNEGTHHLQFESTVGHHSVTLRYEADEVKTKTYQVEFKNPGHYTINLKFIKKLWFVEHFPLDHGNASGFEVSYSPQAMEFVPVSAFRKKTIVGIWKDVSGSGLSFMFTQDGAMVRDDGFATKFRWLGKEQIELYADGFDDTVLYEILSLGKCEMILKTEAQSAHFERGVTITEAELAKQEADFRKRREEAAQNFKNVAMGVATVLAAGGFAILCGAAAASTAGGSGSSSGGGGGRSDATAIPSSSGPRLTEPTTPQSTPARRRQVAALCGAVIVASDERNFNYKKRCDCGHVEPGQTNSSMPSAGSVINSSFPCSKCGRTQEIRIQGS